MTQETESYLQEFCTNKVLVKIKKLYKDIDTPSYSNIGDACVDLVGVTKKYSETYVEFGTGISIEMPEGYVGLVFPRSSVSKKDLLLCNSVGCIDESYRGEIKVRFKKLGDREYDCGDRIAQLMVIPIPKIVFEEVEELSDTVRGEGGFGSTGN